VILRNLAFDLKGEHLTPTFSKFGKIKGIEMPMKEGSTKLNRGFAFMEFESKEEAERAIEAFHGKKFKGRVVTMELSVPKERYEKRV
jgi:multiple RNA-binding domain-containing protein 1